MSLALPSRSTPCWGLSLAQGAQLRLDMGSLHADPASGNLHGADFWLSVPHCYQPRVHSDHRKESHSELNSLSSTTNLIPCQGHRYCCHHPASHSDRNPGAMTPHKSWEFNSSRSLHAAPSSPTPLPHLSSLFPWFLATPLNLLPSRCSTL